LADPSPGSSFASLRHHEALTLPAWRYKSKQDKLGVKDRRDLFMATMRGRKTAEAMNRVGRDSVEP